MATTFLNWIGIYFFFGSWEKAWLVASRSFSPYFSKCVMDVIFLLKYRIIPRLLVRKLNIRLNNDNCSYGNREFGLMSFEIAHLGDSANDFVSCSSKVYW